MNGCNVQWILFQKFASQWNLASRMKWCVNDSVSIVRTTVIAEFNSYMTMFLIGWMSRELMPVNESTFFSLHSLISVQYFIQTLFWIFNSLSSFIISFYISLSVNVIHIEASRYTAMTMAMHCLTVIFNWIFIVSHYFAFSF